jgi:hypothetical protein
MNKGFSISLTQAEKGIGAFGRCLREPFFLLKRPPKKGFQ